MPAGAKTELSLLEQIQALFSKGLLGHDAAIAQLARVLTQWFQGPVAITQLFGCTGIDREPASGSCLHYHNGIDVAVPNGTAVLAGVEGVITRIGYDPAGYGNYITIKPVNAPNYQILLGHLADTRGNLGKPLLVGDGLHLGDIVGHVGSTGNSSGPHLHFSVSQLGGGAAGPFTPVNPVPWLLGLAGQGSELAPDSPQQKEDAALHGLPDIPNPFAGVGDALSHIAAFFDALRKPRTWFIALGALMMGAGVILYASHREEREVIAAGVREAVPKEA